MDVVQPILLFAIVLDLTYKMSRKKVNQIIKEFNFLIIKLIHIPTTITGCVSTGCNEQNYPWYG